jgi:hypothetical protein
MGHEGRATGAAQSGKLGAALQAVPQEGSVAAARTLSDLVHHFGIGRGDGLAK